MDTDTSINTDHTVDFSRGFSPRPNPWFELLSDVLCRKDRLLAAGGTPTSLFLGQKEKMIFASEKENTVADGADLAGTERRDQLAGLEVFYVGEESLVRVL